MRRPRTLPAFSEDEFVRVHTLLASKVATMMGRKLEEGDWSSAYCAAKNIPERGWSNLNIDVVHGCLGIEHKMLCVRSDKTIKEFCGTSLMHPAATRSIRIPSTSGEPTETARDVLSQYAELIEQRRQKVAENDPNMEPDMRVGWVLWQESLIEFLYFEQEMLPPNPEDYWAEWKESGGGARKTSKNLWVYEIETDRKRYSITTTAGAKIQPYFDVPAPNDPNLYYFCVQGERYGDNTVRIWITETTARLLREILGKLDRETLSSTIIRVAQNAIKEEREDTGQAKIDLAEPILISTDAYQALTQVFSGVSDEHRIQMFIRSIPSSS